jgi:FKBP-type peptidyl-prolyl cis-trans isomerase FklB
MVFMRILIALGILTVATSVSAQQAATPAPAAPRTQTEKLSYAVGMNLGRQFKAQSVDVDPDMLARGMRDTLAGKTALTEDEARAVMEAFQNEMRTKQQAMMAQAAEKNAKEGEAFLAANKTKEGVVTTPSGLQYKVITAGTGPKPTLDDTVVCHYRGTLINGTEFDSSYKRNEPAKFPVKGVIKGWTEALQLMPVGSKWQLWVPSALAYGDRGAGPDIGPNTMLIFEVELISIQPKQ